MANAELNVILSADGKQLAATMQKAEKDVQGLEKEVKDLPKAFDAADKAVLKTTSQLNKVAAASQKTSKQLSNVGVAANKAKGDFTNVSRVIQDLPFGLIGIQNNLTQLIPGVGFLGLAFSGLVSALTFSQVGLSNWIRGTKGSADAANDAKEKAEQWAEQQKALKDAFDDAAKSIINQTTKIEDLGKALVDTSNKTALLTGETIKQGLAQLLFTKKEGAVQKILSDRLEKQLKVEEKLLAFRESEFKAANKTAQRGPIRLIDEQELRAAGVGLNQIEKQVFDINKLASSLGISFDDFVDDPKKGKTDKFFDDLLKRVRLAEKFINEQTIRFANFEIDPDESKADTIKKANKFLDDVFNNRSVFMIKTQVILQAVDLKPTQAYFESQKNNAQKLRDDLQEEINKLNKRNPVLIQAQRVETVEKARGAEFFGALGISDADENAPKGLLTDAQKAAVNLATTVRQSVIPAFDSLFNAILSGQNPLKSFFDTLIQSVQQLIQKLLSAVVQALFLSAITGGKANFGKALTSILGFKAEGGPVFANKPYVVGERGPELFIPQGGGRIIPNNEMNSGLSGVTGGSMHITVDSVISGRNLRLVTARQGQYNNRNV